MKDSTIDEEKPVIKKELFFVYKYTHVSLCIIFYIK